MKHTLFITIRVEVESPLGLIESANEMESTATYTLCSTENVEVLESEILKTVYSTFIKL